MIIYKAESQGCAYSIDSEGALFYSPLYVNGTVNLDDWSEVDHLSLLGEEENFREEVESIHQQLIDISKLMGEYFQGINVSNL